MTHRSLISRTENLINCLKCSLADALSVLPECLSVQKNHNFCQPSPKKLSER
jgi:hypothetical protein